MRNSDPVKQHVVLLMGFCYGENCCFPSRFRCCHRGPEQPSGGEALTLPKHPTSSFDISLYFSLYFSSRCVMAGCALAAWIRFTGHASVLAVTHTHTHTRLSACLNPSIITPFNTLKGRGGGHCSHNATSTSLLYIK